MGMIPKVFYLNHPGLDLFASLRPAREVGGDFYDFFIINNKLYITVGDVSGKGVPASLVMAITCRLIRLIATQTDSPAQMATELNNSISEENVTNMFVTMFIGVLDLADGTFCYCNAGHNPPILALPDQSADFHKVEANLPIGVIHGYEFTEQRMQLPDHGAFFLYTDGVNEAENKNAEQFGNSRMLASAFRHCYESARSIVSHVLDAVDIFTADAEQSDDITMLCLRYHKTDSEQEAHHEEETLSISNKLEQVSQLPDFIESYCSTLPVPPSLILSLNLAIEEAMVNCVQYAYPAGTEGDISLSVHWNDLHHELTFVLRDAGMPFDPTAVPAPDVSLGVEERPIGGLGILLVRKIMDTVSYSRENDQNVLTMSKKIYAHTTS
jgi:sigma-B regulation protein RsbU (phosphoserine phosphatase)